MNVTPFPKDHWRIFQSAHLVRDLLQDIPELLSQDDWPTTEDWQDHADRLGIWDLLPKRLCFQAQKPLGQRARRKQRNRESYESSILEKGEIPTRAANLHDFFNALIWLRYPRAKWALHQRAFHSQMENQLSGRRSELCDRLTCFDEGGLIFRLPLDLEREEVEALFQSRDEGAKRRFCEVHWEHFSIFGHGVLEVLFAGRSSVFASCCVISCEQDRIDESLATYLGDSKDHGGIDLNWLSDR